MKRSRTELIVPVRDRRQHRRILTLRNFAIAAAVGAAALVGITIEANLRNPKTEDFGRLYGNRIAQPAAPPVSRKVDIIREGTINDQIAADPTLVSAQARAQILSGEADKPPVQTTTATAPQGAMIGHDSAGRLVVVGGPEGVTLVQKDNAKPVLGGGFGRH